MGAEYLLQNIVLWMRMAQMLAKRFGVGDTDFCASLGAPTFHAFDVAVHPMLFLQPGALAVMASQRPRLLLDMRRNINDRRHARRLAKNVVTFNRIGVI